MRILKTWLSLTLCLLLALAAIPAATAETAAVSAEENAVVKFTYWEGSPSDKAAWDLVLDGFRADHPEIELQAEAYPSSSYKSKLDTMIAGDNWPDVMRYTYQRLGKFREAGVMLDLSGMISQESLDDLLPAYRAAFTDGDKLLGMPHHTDTIALFYNKTMLEKSGIRIPTGATDGWSWDELKEYAAKLKADNGLDYAFGGIWENTSAYRYLPFVYMNGGALLNEDGTQITVNTPEFLQAIELYDTLRKDNLIIGTGFMQSAQVNSLFVANQLAFVFAGSWHCSYMQENMGDNWGVTYMPQVNGKTGSDMGGNGLFAYAGTKYPKACAIFIDYITKAENMRAFCEAGNFLPVRKSLSGGVLNYEKFPDAMKVFNDIVATVDPKMAADETSARFQQLNMAFAEILDPLAVNSSITPQDAVDQMQIAMQDILAE